MYYSENDYRNYLAHHGVVGMHWGIRRYQPYSVRPRKGGKGGKEMGEAKHLSVGTRMAMHLRKKSNSKAYKERLKASKSRTRLMRAIHTQRSKNYAEQGKYYDNRVKGIKQSRLGMKYHRLSGRTTTVGRKLISDSFTPATMYSLAKDAKYLRDKRKKSSAQHFNSNGTMKISKSDSSVTKRVKKDYNALSDKEFASKYKTSRKVYAKRVSKYGDPYMNSPLTKWAKKQNEKQRAKNATKMSKQSPDSKKYSQLQRRNQLLKADSKGNLHEYDDRYKKKYGKK